MKWRAKELLWVSQAHDCLLYWASVSISQPSLGSQSSNRWASLRSSFDESYEDHEHPQIPAIVELPMAMWILPSTPSERFVFPAGVRQERRSLCLCWQALICGDVTGLARRGFYGWNGHGIFLVYMHMYIYIYIHDMIWYDMIWHDMIWFDMTWYDIIYYNIV